MSTQSRHPPPIMPDSTDQSFNFHGCNFLCDYFLSSKDENGFHTHSNVISFSESWAPRLESVGMWVCVYMCVSMRVCLCDTSWFSDPSVWVLALSAFRLSNLFRVKCLLRLKLKLVCVRFKLEVCIWHINLTPATFIGWWFKFYLPLWIYGM